MATRVQRHANVSKQATLLDGLDATTRVQCHANVSKQATLLDGLDASPLKWHVCGCGLNRFVHEGMNHISNVEVHLKTHSGNVNMLQCTHLVMNYSVLIQISRNNLIN